MKDKIKDIFKNNTRFVVVIFLCIIGLALIVQADTTFVLESNYVIYNNQTSGLSATNVEDAIDELYDEASNYEAFDARLTAAENKLADMASVEIISTTGLTWDTTKVTSTLVSMRKVGKLRILRIEFTPKEDLSGWQTVATLTSGNCPYAIVRGVTGTGASGADTLKNFQITTACALRVLGPKISVPIKEAFAYIAK